MTDAPTDEVGPGRTGRSERWLLLIALCAMQFALMAGDTAVNIALPNVADAFQLAPVDLAWVVNGYMLAFGGLLVVAGRLGDRYGLVRVFTVGTVVFGLASVAASLAPSAIALVAIRFIQGVGAALIAPAILGMISVLFIDETRRGKAFAIWSGTMVLGGTVGMLLSGVLTEFFTWRASFLITVPMAVAGLAVARKLSYVVPVNHRHVPVDISTALLLVVAVGTLSYGLSAVSTFGFNSRPVFVGLAVAALCSVLFVFAARRSRAPVIPRTLLRDRDRMTALLAGMLATGGMFSTFFTMTLYLRDALGGSALAVSLAYVPTGLACLLGSWCAARFLSQFGARLVLIAGYSVSAVGVLSLVLLANVGGYPLLMPGLVLFGCGMSAATPAVAQAAVAGVETDDAGVCGAAVNSSQQVGGTIGLALTAVVFQLIAGQAATALLVPFLLIAAAAASGLFLARTKPSIRADAKL